jgi:5'-deoxynucleotidase YfbR-like HD superfamily hydrolase
MIFDKYIKTEYLRRIDHTHRFQGSPIIQSETISSHSWWHTFFARILPTKIFNVQNICVFEEPNGVINLIARARLQYFMNLLLEITSYSIFHDLPEIFSGDISHEVKYNEFNGEEICKALKDFEDSMMLKHFSDESEILKLSNHAQLPPFEKKILKICDWLSLVKQLENEYSLGNRNLGKVLVKTKSALLKINNELFIELKDITQKGTDFDEQFVDWSFFNQFEKEIKDYTIG